MGILDTVERVHLGLDYHIQRHNLLTANLTQIDTPGFRPLDLVRGQSFEGALNAALTETSPMHMGGAQSAERFDVREDPSAGVGFDGNGVRDLAEPSHCSKSASARDARSFCPFFTAAISVCNAGQRARSATAGTNMLGGVSAMFPSIAGMVLLRKNAVSA